MEMAMVSGVWLQTGAAAPTSKLGNLYDLILAGGPIMIPIGLCSVVALAYFVERLAALSRARLAPSSFRGELESALAHEPVGARAAKAALELCERMPRIAIARVMAAGLRRWDASRSDVERAVEEAGSREVGTMTRRLRPLVIITAIAPLLGLLGTVTGMIQAFQVMALQKGIGKPELLAGGIAEALVTTAAGLFVAIPVQVAYYWLKAKVDRFASAIEVTFDAALLPRLEARERALAPAPPTPPTAPVPNEAKAAA
jgi:biopolymer transport protein ExbB